MAGERAPQPSGGQGGRCLWMPYCRNANRSLGLGGGVGHVCLYLPPSPCLFSVLSSSCAPSPLFLSHLDSHLLSPFSSLPPIALCFKVSKPDTFKGGPLTITPALAHILPTQEERAFSSFQRNPREEIQMNRIHLWISHSGQGLVLWGL